ncbi:MAG: hypothetical protein LBB90_05530 [Tannerella sp.]|nr:hypothetical protein [Tannerella sp.]
MDNYLGDWLYYIVILVVAIVSFVSNLNKKKSQGQTLPPAPSPSMEEVLPPLPPVQTQRKKSPPPAPKSFRPSSVSFLSGAEEGRQMLAGNTPDFVEEKETAWTDELDLTDADAFRKAFIAAEILNRKY